MRRTGLTFLQWMVGAGVLLALALLLLLAPRLGVSEARGAVADGQPFAGAILPCLLEEAEPNDDVSVATNGPSLCMDTRLFGALPAGDREELYWIEVPAEGIVEIDLREIVPGQDYDLYLYNSALQEIAASTEHGHLPERIVIVLDEGQYVLRVYPFEGRSEEPYYVRWRLVGPGNECSTARWSGPAVVR